jgi:peptidoglycan/xylan/chitin deacetylase (PgdA/CDA1 family)
MKMYKLKLNNFLLLGIAIITLTTCSVKKEEMSAREKIPMVICFDVEDYTSPESVGMDDIPKWLAEIMTDEGVTGSFFVIGEKARMMERRGRKDVIEAMARHDIGSHTNFGSIHPTVTEILEYASWDKGIETILKNETIGFDDLERIFGQRPANLARHGGSYGPQLTGALSQLNAGYVYSPISLPGHNAVWFCNTLNFYGEGDYGFFDDAYYRDDLFNPMLEALDSLIPASIKDIDVMAFFACHPSKVRSIQFWDSNYYKGANPGPDEWKTPELRPLESMETAQKNFRRLVQYLKNRDDIELTTFRELTERFSYQKDEICKDELGLIASRILKENKIVIDELFSGAEVFSALVESLDYYHTEQELPGQVKIKRPFGPLEMPLTNPEFDHIPANGVLEIAGAAQEYIEETNHLPASLNYDGKKIGTGSMLALFSEMFLKIQDANLPDQFSTLAIEAYPSVNEENIIRTVAECKEWPVHRKDLDMSHLIEMTKLQLWTLKPARVE